MVGKALITFSLAIIILSYTAQADFTGEDQFGIGITISVAWGDYDDDGDLDLAIGNYNQQNRLYINNGDGTFTGEDQFGTGYTLSIAWGDYDDDGDLDLAAGSYFDEQSHLYVNNGDGTFSEEDQFGIGETMSLAWGDCDKDGDLDLAVGNSLNQQNRLYVNNGDGTFSGENQFGNGWTRSMAWGDYDEDGDIDLAVGDSTQQNYLYINNGDGTFSGEDQFGTGYTQSIAWGDYDNDRDLDLAVGDTYDQQNRLYVNNGEGVFTGENQFGSGYTLSIAWGDYDQDGDLDLAVGNGGQNRLYINNNDGTFTGDNQFGSESTFSIAWGDYDRDGDLDLAVGNWGWQNRLYINNEDDGDYLNLHLIGHHYDEGSGYSNRNGIGAKVYLYEEGYVGDDSHLLGLREIEANGGYCGQDSIDAEFGLPDSDYVDVLVIWPGSDGSYIEEAWTSVAKGQFLTLHEGTGSPLDVILRSFNVQGTEEGLLVRWVVEATADGEITGFNLYRRYILETRPIIPVEGPVEKTFDEWTKVNGYLIRGDNPYVYVDNTVDDGVTYEYKLKAVLADRAETLGVATGTAGDYVPTTYALYQSRPNPAEGTAVIAFDLPEDAKVTLAVYDVSGRKVTMVVDGTLTVGTHKRTVSGLAPGVYVYKLSAGSFNAAKKMVIVE